MRLEVRLRQRGLRPPRRWRLRLRRLRKQLCLSPPTLGLRRRWLRRLRLLCHMTCLRTAPRLSVVTTRRLHQASLRLLQPWECSLRRLASSLPRYHRLLMSWRRMRDGNEQPRSQRR